MSDYVTLLGAADVRQAAESMRSSVETFSRAVGEITMENYREGQRRAEFQAWADAWLARFEAAVRVTPCHSPAPDGPGRQVSEQTPS